MITYYDIRGNLIKMHNCAICLCRLLDRQSCVGLFYSLLNWKIKCHYLLISKLISCLHLTSTVKKLGFSMRHAIMYLLTYLTIFTIFLVESNCPKHIFSNFFNRKLFCQKIVVCSIRWINWNQKLKLKTKNQNVFRWCKWKFKHFFMHFE